jgi:hypothetical protein
MRSNLLSALLLAALTTAAPAIAQTSAKPKPAKPATAPVVAEKVAADTGLTLATAAQLVEEAKQAVNQQNYELAEQKFLAAKKAYELLVQFHSDLSGAFSGIDLKISADQRKKVVEAAQARDNAKYRLGLVYRALNQPSVALPLFVQVVQSQNPTTELGQAAYAQLVELGFASTPYPRPAVEGATPAPAPATPAQPGSK